MGKKIALSYAKPDKRQQLITIKKIAVKKKTKKRQRGKSAFSF